MQKERIYIVEDESVVALDIATSLEGMGYIAGQTDRGPKLPSSRLRNCTPDLVLMDIRLKGEMTGIDAAEFVHTHFDIPVVFISAHSDTLTLQAAMMARTTAKFQFVEDYYWIPAYHISYTLGVDGLSVSMVLLTALLSFLCIFASLGIEKAGKGYFSLFLMLGADMMGVFCALDFFLFYVFWEVMLLPMYFLIGIWGGPRREYAAIKFFLYPVRQHLDAPGDSRALFHR